MQGTERETEPHFLAGGRFSAPVNTFETNSSGKQCRFGDMP